MKLLTWIKWLTICWSIFLLIFFIMWLFYLSDKFGALADFFKPLPDGMSNEARNTATWMYVSAFFPDLIFVIIPYWTATMGYWMKARWSLCVLMFATGAWFYSSLNEWMCRVSLGMESFLPHLVNEILVSYALPALILMMAMISHFKYEQLR